MTKALPVIVLSTLLFGGAAFAQSFEPPSIPELSDFPGVGIPQIDPPSLEISVGPSDVDLADLGEAIGEAIDGAWEGQPAGGPGEAFNPDLFEEPAPGAAVLDLLDAVEEALRRGLQQGRLILDSDAGAIEEALRRGLQQGRLILDSDSNETSDLPNPPLRGEPTEGVEK